MRYFGKDGPQCQIQIDLDSNKTAKCRQVARGVLFGRVPKAAVIGLGLAVIAILATVSIFSVCNVSNAGSRFCRDQSAAVMTRR